MNKTFFKGTINGKVFDNVNDYNKEMTRLLNAGARINAHSSTTSESNSMDSSALSGFSLPMDYKETLDSFNGNKSNDEKILKEIELNLSECYNNLCEEIKNYKESDIKDYLDDINNITGLILQSKNDTDKATKSINEKMHKLESEKNILNKCQEAIAAYYNFYLKLAEELDNYLEKFEDNQKSKQFCKCGNSHDSGICGCDCEDGNECKTCKCKNENHSITDAEDISIQNLLKAFGLSWLYKDC